MNKLFAFCLLVAFAFLTIGCNTDVPISEINSALSIDMRCGISGGIPLRQSQAEKVKLIVDFINHDLDHPDNAYSWNDKDIAELLSKDIILGNEYERNKSNGTNNLAVFIRKIHESLKGGRLLYGSVQMSSIYKYAYANLSIDGEDEDLYCTCGYEFCEKDSACTIDQVTNFPVCGANTTIELQFDKDTLECNPINLSKTPLKGVLLQHQLPILQFMAGFREKWENDKITVNDSDRVTSLINCADASITDPDACITAQKFYKYMIECINIGDSTFPQDKRSNCPNYDGSTTECTERPCMGELYIAGFPHTAKVNFYAGLKEIAERQINAAKKGADASFAQELNGLTVSKYLVDQVAPIYVSSITDMSAIIGGIQNAIATNGVDNIPEDQVFSAMRTFLQKTYASFSEGMATLHRQFFGWLTVDNMTENDIRTLYTSTLTVRLLCDAQDLPNGDISGLKKYCIYRDDLPASLNDILSAMQSTTESVVKMADAMIMNGDLIIDITVNQQAGKIIFDTVKSVMYQSFSKDKDGKDEYKQMLGDWLLLRCPNNASCMLNNQCGSCTNGMINKLGQTCKDGIYQ